MTTQSHPVLKPLVMPIGKFQEWQQHQLTLEPEERLPWDGGVQLVISSGIFGALVMSPKKFGIVVVVDF